MQNTITVTGTGRVSAAPDFVVLSMSLEALNLSYEAAMEAASSNIAELTAALEKAGFEKKELKTTDFRVSTLYDSVRRKSGEYERVFKGYRVGHDLKLSFDFSAEALSRALSAVAGCGAAPDLGISFTVKDPASVKDEMLRSAAENARRNAAVLAEASGKALGELISINYSWGELNIISDTRYEMAEDCMTKSMLCEGMDFTPDDIDVRDSATFTWELV